MEESGPASYYELLLGYMVCSEYSRIRFYSEKISYDSVNHMNANSSSSYQNHN